MSTFIDEVFADFTGPIARAKAGYSQREGQVKLAKDIEAAITTGSILLAEGPCGIGKSYAYLIPAIKHALKTGRPALVITANKALQDQLAEKDLPFLQTALKEELPDFKFQILKGRSNYLCQREMSLYDGNADGIKVLRWPSDLENEGDALSAWAGLIPVPDGERGSAPYGISDRTWKLASVSADDCDRFNCQFKETCFAETALRNAQVSHVVVANYDLLFHKLLHSGDPMWSKFSCVILDESHEASNIARRCFNREVSSTAIKKFATFVADHIGEHQLAKNLRSVIDPFFDKIANYAIEQRGGRLRDPDFIDTDNVEEALEQCGIAARGSCGNCVEGESCGACNDREKIRTRSKELIKDITAFVAQSDDQTAYWFDKPGDTARITGATVKLCAAPYDVGDKLRRLVFEKFPATICVSATMTSGNSFDFIRNELGLAKPELAARTKTVRIPTPFDYKKQAKFIIPLGIPFPVKENEVAFDIAAVGAIKQLIADCRGRTLALFTSWKRLNYVASQLENKIDYPLLVQGRDGQNKHLAHMFREQKDSVLLATRSFWMGLDVSGEALTCLIIDKLPFESFDDPFVDMWKTKHPDTYYEQYYVPRAAIALAQGAGRLIRSADDVGVFVLLDQRIIAHRYGRSFMASLPFVGPPGRAVADAGKFLAEAEAAKK